MATGVFILSNHDRLKEREIFRGKMTRNRYKRLLRRGHKLAEKQNATT